MTGLRGRRWFATVAAAALFGLAVAPATTAALLVNANDDDYTAAHDRVLNVSAAAGVLDNDTGIGLTAAKRTNPGHGTVTVNSNGSFTYQPAAGYIGPDSFTYDARVLNLGILVTDTATVHLTVTNEAPVASNDAYTATTGVKMTVSAPGVLGDDSDGDGDSLTAILVDGGGNGSLDLNSNGSFTFTSGGSFTGTRTFTYRASDGIDESNIATVTITVSAPVATPTPAPTPAPTAPPTATPRPTPTPTPRPTPTPIIPLPTLPLPTTTLPPLPTLLPTATPTLPLPTLSPTPTIPGRPTPTPTPVPGASGGPGPRSSTPPGGTPAPKPDTTSSPSPTPNSGASDAPGVGSGGTDAGGSGTGLGAAPGDRFLLPPVDPSGIDALIDGSFNGFGGIEWAVPAFALGVPGFLLMIAVAIQTIVGAAWLPFVRRWLGGFGVRRRERSV